MGNAKTIYSRALEAREAVAELRDAYPDDVIASWAERIRAQPWREAFVYVKHDDGDAPSVSLRLAAALAAA